jgi:hypothetical protein
MPVPSKPVKKVTAKKPTAKTAAPPAISKAQAVRLALKEGVDTPAEISAFTKAKFGLDIPAKQASVYRYQITAKERKGTSATTKKLIPAAAKHGGGGETDLIGAMEMLKPLVKEHGAERLKKIVDLLG